MYLFLYFVLEMHFCWQCTDYGNENKAVFLSQFCHKCVAVFLCILWEIYRLALSCNLSQMHCNVHRWYLSETVRKELSCLSVLFCLYVLHWSCWSAESGENFVCIVLHWMIQVLRPTANLLYLHWIAVLFPNVNPEEEKKKKLWLPERDWYVLKSMKCVEVNFVWRNVLIVV